VLGLCDAANGQLEEATYHDRIATYLDPEFAMPRLHLGLMLRRSGDRKAASLELTHARSLLEREDPKRLALFGGGFGRAALLELCVAELSFAGGRA
jgi:chemotaxis protein methyltransferase CheR